MQELAHRSWYAARWPALYVLERYLAVGACPLKYGNLPGADGLSHDQFRRLGRSLQNDHVSDLGFEKLARSLARGLQSRAETVKRRVELRPVATLMPQAGQLRVRGVGNARQHFQREQPLLLLRAQLSGEIEDIVVQCCGAAVAECESHHLASSPTRAAFIDINAFSGWRPGNRAQSLGDQS
jgi:hypothetical protein